MLIGYPSRHIRLNKRGFNVITLIKVNSTLCADWVSLIIQKYKAKNLVTGFCCRQETKIKRKKKEEEKSLPGIYSRRKTCHGEGKQV